MEKNKKNGFIVQAGILAAAGIIVRIIGILYRSPLVAVIGDEGNGYYSTAYTIYTIILLISTNGIPSAVSKIVSGQLAKREYRNAHRVFMGAFCYVVIAGGIASAFCFIFADKIVGASSAMVLKVFTPTIFLSGLLGVFRGYFQAHGSMVQTSLSQILEQIANAIMSIVAALVFISLVAGKDESVKAVYGAMGSAMGTGVGVLTALLFMMAAYAVNSKMFLKRRKYDKTTNIISYKNVFKIIITMVTPVILSTCIYNLSSVTNLQIYCKISEQVKGYTESQATLFYGLYSGKANPITNIPIAFAAAMSAAIIPAISGSFEKGNKKEARDKIGEGIKITMLLSIPSAVGMAVLARPIVFVLYPQKDSLEVVAGLLMILSVSVIFYGLSTLTNGVLQATGNVNKPVIHAAVSLLIQSLVLSLLLMFTQVDVYGMAMAAVCYSFVMCVMNGLSLKKKLGYKQEVMRTFILPGIASLCMGVAAFSIYHGINYLLVLLKLQEKGDIHWTYNIISLLPALIVAVIVYFILVIKLGAVTKRELSGMPGGRTLARFIK